MNQFLDRLADMDTRFKVLLCFFIIAIVPACLNLFLLNSYTSGQILPFAGLYLAVLIVIFFPLCGLVSNLLVLRNISKINAYCQKVKQGRYHLTFDLPPEKGEENDFIRAKRNLYWMGEIIASREKRLISALEGTGKGPLIG